MALLPDSRRRVDVAFPRIKVAIFIDGCFWHGCPLHFKPPQTNVRYWTDKIDRNRERDSESTLVLTQAGWSVLRFWEHEDPQIVAAQIVVLVREARLGEKVPGKWGP